LLSCTQVIGLLSSYKTRIRNLDDLDAFRALVEQKGVKGFGAGFKSKLRELVTTGELQQLRDLRSPEVTTLLAFMKIHGVGPVIAKQLYEKYKSLDELREHGQHHLDDRQRIGLRHYKDLQERIPRSEVLEIEKVTTTTTTLCLSLLTRPSFQRLRRWCRPRRAT
jgi:DNA polymerase/3'-5' exonuclease PolX